MTNRYMLDTVAGAGGIVPPLPKTVKVPGGSVVPVSLQAGYVNGSYAWKSRFPDVWIDTNGSDPKATVLDCENLDATPAQTPGWAKAHNAETNPAPEFPAVIYANRSNLTPIFNAMDHAGLHVAKDFFLWVATLDGTVTLPDMTGVVAVQVWGASAIGLNADLSVVFADSFPHGGTPPPQKGPFEHFVHAGNTESLYRVAVTRGLKDESSLVSLTRDNLTNPERLAAFNDYVMYSEGATAAGMPHPPMGPELAYYTVNP